MKNNRGKKSRDTATFSSSYFIKKIFYECSGHIFWHHLSATVNDDHARYTVYSHLSETNSRLRVMSETNRPAERLTKTCVMSLWWKMGLFWERVNVFYCTIYCTVTAGQNDVTLSAIFTRITSFDLKNKLINCIVFSEKTTALTVYLSRELLQSVQSFKTPDRVAKT